jgi:predicted transcriptional regulator
MKKQVAEIVAAYVGNNAIAPDQLPILITVISDALARFVERVAVIDSFSVPTLLATPV